MVLLVGLVLTLAWRGDAVRISRESVDLAGRCVDGWSRDRQVSAVCVHLLGSCADALVAQDVACSCWSPPEE
jgi:hypothetical protein